MNKKRGQIGAEYLIVISFILFIVLSTLGIALNYSSKVRDTLKFNQIETFSKKIISKAETVYYAGAPSKTRTTGYLPEGINEITIQDNFIIFNVSTSAGNAVTAFRSNVNLTGTISPTSGVKVIHLDATQNSVVIS